MTLELLFYLFLILAGLLLCLCRINNTVYNVVTFLLFISFAFIVRNAGFDADIGNYVLALKVKSFSLYYIKEPIYWLGARLIHDFTGSEHLVFLFYDCVFIILLLSIRATLDLPKYFPYLIFLFFPSVLGMQNVFRQFIASGFLLLLFSQAITSKKILIKMATFIIAGLSHNVALLFLPLVFLKVKEKNLNVFFIGSSLSILTLLPIAAASKSNSITGEVSPVIYVVLFTAMIFAYTSIFNFKFKNKPPKYIQFLYFFLYCYILIIEAMVVLGAAQSKRLAMLALLLSLIPLVISIEYRFRQRIIVRCLFFSILVAPTLAFNNSVSLLQTTTETLKAETHARSQNNHGTH